MKITIGILCAAAALLTTTAGATAQTHVAVAAAPMAHALLTNQGLVYTASPDLDQATAPQAPKVVAPAVAGQHVPPPPPAPPVPPVPAAGSANLAHQTVGTAPVAMPKVQLPKAKGQPVNIKVEFTITDQLGSKAASKKTVMATVADASDSRIRSMVTAAVKRGSNWDMRNAPLSVDVQPTIDGQKIRVEFALEYNMSDDPSVEGAPTSQTQVSERLTVLLADGVSAVVAQAMDPLTDRKVTVEVKATILK